MISREKFISLLTRARICHVSEVRTASESDVAALEQAVGQRLPLQYRSFLIAVGSGAGRFFEGTDIFLSSLHGLTEAANALLAENGEAVGLPDDAFVFSMHQGYEFTYFRMSEGDDPPVYQYVEGSGPAVLAWESFSGFLAASIVRHAGVISQHFLDERCR